MLDLYMVNLTQIEYIYDAPPSLDCCPHLHVPLAQFENCKSFEISVLYSMLWCGTLVSKRPIHGLNLYERFWKGLRNACSAITFLRRSGTCANCMIKLLSRFSDRRVRMAFEMPCATFTTVNVSPFFCWDMQPSLTSRLSHSPALRCIDDHAACHALLGS